MATKEQELKALDKIAEIVAELGKDSYIGTAFEGCFAIAEENIDNDFLGSMRQKYERASEEAADFEAQASEHRKQVERLTAQVERLTAQIEREQEWKPYEDTHTVSQADYERLVDPRSGTRYLSDDEAKELLYDWFGFAKERIKIHHSVPTYEISRHHQLRKVGEVDRRPAYNATDWHYIRFDCGTMAYELYNDSLRFF